MNRENKRILFIKIFFLEINEHSVMQFINPTAFSLFKKNAVLLLNKIMSISVVIMVGDFFLIIKLE